ncbi:hypothetical protein TrVFT333_001611 [Trichoderma virens FT-333]|nr:hypothetical protein TrVFT333_001611 [Trichoderma virens FT-333]
MGDYYRQFLSTMSGADGYLPTSPDEMNQVLGPGIPLPMSTPPMHSPYPSTMGNMGYFAGYPDPTIINAPKASKSRRRSAASQGGNLDQVKHRRTRSGCYTCRSRRVKCDETRPICDRKGVETVFTLNRQDPKETRLGTIPDDDEPDGLPRRESISAFSQPRRASAASPNMALTSARQTSETPSQDGNKSVSPSTSNVTTGSWTPAGYQGVEAILPASGGLDRLHLPQDFRSYLRYFKENMTNYHYGLAVDEDDFFNSELPSVAIQCEPLLNALVGFAAYHVTLQNPHGQLQDFLQYYNKSVTQLLSLLKRKETHSVHVLLTILQLATIEEYLGDWVNLMGHQKAAFEILTQIYTPETAMQTSIGRMCLSWYARFDNIVALMGRFPTEIPREWFTTMIAYYQTQMASNPTELRWKIEDRSARLRLISYDMSTFPDDIVNPYRPGLLYDHPLFNSTVITMEWHSIVIMHKTQSPNISPEQLFSELGGHAFTVCELFECLEHINPATRREKMAEIFGDPSCARWWLPNDEGFTPILQSVRSFADERNARAVNTQQVNLREVKHLFDKLIL